MKLSARNQIKGTIIAVVKGATTSHVTVEIAGGQKIVASITNEAVDELAPAPEQATLPRKTRSRVRSFHTYHHVGRFDHDGRALALLQRKLVDGLIGDRGDDFLAASDLDRHM